MATLPFDLTPQQTERVEALRALSGPIKSREQLIQIRETLQRTRPGPLDLIVERLTREPFQTFLILLRDGTRVAVNDPFNVGFGQDVRTMYLLEHKTASHDLDLNDVIQVL